MSKNNQIINSFITSKDENLLRKLVGLDRKNIDELRELNFLTLKHLLEAIHKYNPKLLVHSFKVAEMCRCIANELKFSVDEINIITLGSLLHDIGVIGLEKDLFTKEIIWNKNKLEEYYKHTMSPF